jgi:phospholipid/cholesterol/gamma-HCH transport system permease protein
MDTPADFSVDETSGVIRLTGDWTVSDIGDAAERLNQAIEKLATHPSLDLEKVGRVDTAGAYRLIKVARDKIPIERVNARPETRRLVRLVAEALEQERAPPKQQWSVNAMMERLGKGVIGVSQEILETLTFWGHLMVVLARALTKPKRLRLPALFSVAERAGLDAIPIVAVTNFFVGAVIGLIAVNTLAEFGFQAFAVEGVGIGILREFNIVITAVLLAGRSASSFAAEIGSMKMQQEIDAMRVMGVDPFEALVLPRFLALLFITPLLTFIATVAGLSGGCVALWSAAGLGPEFFFKRIAENVGLHHFWIGMSKAPVMAMVVAAIGCRQGLEVGGDVDSLGRRVTAAVVHATFAIIFIDAIFALVYTELDL